MIVQLHRLIVNSCHNITPQQATLRRLLDPWPMENMALQSLVCCMYMLSRRERMSVTVGCGGLCLCLVQVDTLIEKNLLFSITISHLMHLLYSSILLIKISAFCSFRVFIVTCVPSYKSLSTIFLYWVVTLQPMQRCGGLWSPGRAVLCTTGASLPCWCDSRSHWSLIQNESVLLYFYNAIMLPGTIYVLKDQYSTAAD